MRKCLERVKKVKMQSWGILVLALVLVFSLPALCSAWNGDDGAAIADAAAEAAQGDGGGPDPSIPTTTCTYGAFARQEVDGGDGVIVELARALETYGYPVPFYTLGDPASCTSCTDSYYDEVDAMSSKFKDFVTIKTAYSAYDSDQLANSWQTWLKTFYDPDTTWTPTNTGVNADWSDVFEWEIKPKLESWKTEIASLKSQISTEAEYGWWSASNPNQCTTNQTIDQFDRGAPYECVTNPPCKDGSFATVDKDLSDEFALSITEIENVISEIDTFNSEIAAYYSNMLSAYASLDLYGGLNPVTYSWTDSRGDHSIQVKTGPFKYAWLESTKSGSWFSKKLCMHLRDYSDDGTNAWIRVTRKDPAEVSVGKAGIGQWNPLDNDDPLDAFDSSSDGEFSMSRMSRVSYSYDYVKINGRQ